MDIHVQLNTEFKVNQGSTLPSRIRHNFGGVAYNITHALHLLGNSSVRLLTVSGRTTTFQNDESNLSVIEEIPNENTASYVSILDAKTNELICGLGDMGIYERQINREFFEKYRSFLTKSQWIMFDANLSCSAMKDLTMMGNELNKYLVFISAGGPEKARRIRPYLSSIDVLLCNRLEFQSISDSSSIETALDRMMKSNPRLKLISITMGADGVLIGNDRTIKHYRALKINENEKNQIENVTGAGDSFAAGLMNYLLKFDWQNLDRAVTCGLLAAKFTLTSPNTISDRLKTIDKKLIDEICSKELRYELIHFEQTPIRNESSFSVID